MSYDLMVFDANVVPKEREAFIEWYDQLTEWNEDHTYDDPAVCSDALRDWFMEMIQTFPAMDGVYAISEEEFDEDNSYISEYSIARHAIYIGFAWSVADEAFEKVKTLAIKHKVGFFDVSSDDGIILFPGGLAI